MSQHFWLKNARWMDVEFHEQCEDHGEHVRQGGRHIVFEYHGGRVTWLAEVDEAEVAETKISIRMQN